MSEAPVVVTPEPVLRAQLEAMLGALGVPSDQAAVVADNLVEADLRGIDSHGAHLMALYFGRVRSGHLRPVTTVTTLDDHGSTVRLDAALGFGQVAGVAAMDVAIARAREHGVATVTVRELTHLGALAYYTMRAAAEGLIALRVPERRHHRAAVRRDHEPVLDQPVLLRDPGRHRAIGRLRRRHHRRRREQDPPRPQAR